MNKTLNNELKKPSLTKFINKEDMVSPTYIPRKITVRNIHNNKSPRNTNLPKSEKSKILSTKSKNSTHSIMNSVEVDKKKDKNIQKSKYLSKDFNSEMFSNILSKKINKKNIENIILCQKNIFKNRNIDYNENKENIMQNYNNKYDINHKLNKNNNKMKNSDINTSNVDIKIQNNNIISSIQKNNYTKKIISFENRNNNFYNNSTNIKNSKELNSNMIQKKKKKISNNNINNSNCLSNRVIYNYLNNNYINSSNNINNNYDNSFLGNISANQRRKKSFYNCSTNTPDNPKFFINYKISKDTSYLGNNLTFRKVKPKIFYKSPFNKYKCSQKNLQENQTSDEYSNSNINNNIKQNCLIKYPSSRDSTFSQFNIKNSTNLKNKNSYFSLNYTNTDINDNSSIKAYNKKLSKRMKKDSNKNLKNDNIYVKLNKENLLKKSIIIKEYLNKENENYYNNEVTKTDFKMSNKFLSVNLRKKYSDNVIKKKPITYRTLTNFYNKGKTESLNGNDIIIKVNNNNRELSYQKGKKINQNNSMPNNEVIYNVKSIKLSKEEQSRNKTPKRNDKKSKLINNISKGISNGIDNKNKKNEKNDKKDKNDSESKSNKNKTKGSSSTSNHLYNTYMTKNSTNSSFLLNDEIKNLDINTYSEKLYSTENSIKKNENEQKIINLDIFYTLESKLNILLLKLNNYEICYNETQDWISYFFGNYFYEKEIDLFDSEQNKKQMMYYINFELICYFMCYDISFNKNYNQVSILLKTIFNLLHKNYLCLISYIIKKTNEKNEKKDINSINNNYIEEMIIIRKLQEVIKNELKMNLGQDINEVVVLDILKDNFKQIYNYYNMIIENIYSNTIEINDKTNNMSFENNILQKKISYYKFPECLKINILKINDKKKSYIISDFFKNALNSIEFNIKDFKNFYNLYLNKSSDNLFIQQYFHNKRIYSLIPCPLISHSNSEKKIIPPINLEKYNYSLILDLDETLIHLEREYYTFNNTHNIKNKKLTLRPGLINFLEKMKKIYEIILFTFSPNDYADSIIDVIEKDEKYFEYKLYVQNASYNNGKYVKDINDLGRDIKNTIIIEDNINNVHKSNLDNTICIKPFYGECNNEKNTLQLLGNILNKIRYDAEITGDIRTSLTKEKYNIITEISSNLEE